MKGDWFHTVCTLLIGLVLAANFYMDLDRKRKEDELFLKTREAVNAQQQAMESIAKLVADMLRRDIDQTANELHDARKR